MTQYLSLTMDDCKTNEWTYSMQYMGYITRICVSEPLEAMSVTQQESVVSDLLNTSFNTMRERKLLQKPEDSVEDYIDNVVPKIVEEEDFPDLSDISTEDLKNEMIERMLDEDDEDNTD